MANKNKPAVFLSTLRMLTRDDPNTLGLRLPVIAILASSDPEFIGAFIDLDAAIVGLSDYQILKNQQVFGSIWADERKLAHVFLEALVKAADVFTGILVLELRVITSKRGSNLTEQSESRYVVLQLGATTPFGMFTSAAEAWAFVDEEKKRLANRERREKKLAEVANLKRRAESKTKVSPSRSGASSKPFGGPKGK